MTTGSTTDVGVALSDAIHGGYVAHLSGGTYRIDSPIVIHVTETIQGALGIDGGGATLLSEVTNGSPLIQIVVDPGVDFRYLTLSNFNIQGNGQEGSGIQVIADGNDQWAYNWAISNVHVEHVGGYGLDMRGSIFEGVIADSWMDENALGGAYFSHSPSGGVVSALRWLGGGARDNGGPGVVLDNGVRDLGVDGATFAGNAGPGINALWGITAVNNSTFQDNLDYGVLFQNYGSFDGNTFTSSGAQTVGIRGYLAGQARLDGNTAAYTGSGTDQTLLADLQGDGSVYITDNAGRIVSGPRLPVNEMGSELIDVTRTTAGVDLPTLEAITAATTAPVPESTGTGLLETTLRGAIDNGTVAHMTADTYTVTTPIVINVTQSTDGPAGIDLGGAKIISQVDDGLPVIVIQVAPGVELGSLTLSNFSISGSGREGDGIKIVADGPDRSIHDWSIDNVNVEHVGGVGLDVLGNVSHGTVYNSWMHGNDQGGARFAASAGGGVPDELEWIGGGTRKNGVAGLILDNGAHDMTVSGAYFVDNDGPGIVATAGITLVETSGFENNLGAGAVVEGPSTFIGDTFATYGPQTVGVGGELIGGQVTLAGIGSEYYGPGANPTMTANLQGEGALAITGRGNVAAGPDVVVTGLQATVIESQGATSLIQAGDSYLMSGEGSSGPAMREAGVIVDGRLGDWEPIAVETAAGSYHVVWTSRAADQYVVWIMDGGGNHVSTMPGLMSGSSPELQSLEPDFGQDLNGDGTIGVPPPSNDWLA